MSAGPQVQPLPDGYGYHISIVPKQDYPGPGYEIDCSHIRLTMNVPVSNLALDYNLEIVGPARIETKCVEHEIGDDNWCIHCRMVFRAGYRHLPPPLGG